MENFPPKIFFDDLTIRNNTTAPKADLYVAGFPCQPFSTAGLQQGFEDARGRGQIFWHVRDYIEKQQPRVFVLENVAGLVRICNGQYYDAIIEALEALGTYNIYTQFLDTKDNGLPQSRRRIYFVGILRRWDDGSFTFPEPVQRPSIELFLEPRAAGVSESTLPPEKQTTALANVRRALQEIREKGYDPLREPWIIDCDSSSGRMKYYRDLAPCLTCARAAGYWVSNRMRRMTTTEMMRLQGMCPETFKKAVSERQLGTQIGNAMSVNVLERIFVRLLPACGLARHGALTDRWQKGRPPAELVGKGTKRKAAPSQCPAVIKCAKPA
mmetsp:Transcript_54869/g.172149  ORF Transcript_54869/g.172149 Transcript_54869/m.172149 type:complete len:326 (+) Transcript_54869:2-979(+)